MPTKPATLKEFLASLTDERREMIQAIRKVVKANLDTKLKETYSGGMLHYVVPLSVYPDGYHCTPGEPLPYASIASQKNNVSLYLFCIYCAEEEADTFRDAWKATGTRLDMGKSCVRVRKLEELPLDVLGKTIKRVTAKKFIDAYQATRDGAAPTSAKKKAPTKKKAAVKKTGAKKAASKKTAARKAPAKKSKAKKAPAKKRS